MSAVSESRRWFLFLLAAVTWIAHGKPVDAYSPESPEVKKLVKKGAEFITTQAPAAGMGRASLSALALLKADYPSNHSLIKHAVNVCKKDMSLYQGDPPGDSLYHVCVGIIFLTELDPEKYQPEIKQLMELLIKWQKPFGGWGYLDGPHRPTGDTSMTQYAVLASWSSLRTRTFDLNTDSIVNVANWLMRTQDPSGGWGYQGKDPESFKLVPQTNVQNSLSAAGIGSLYMCADILRLTPGSQRTQSYSGEPAGLKRVVKEDSSPKGPLTNQLDMGQMRKSMNAGNNWISGHFTVSPMDWPFYYLYALERYYSFKELAEGKDIKDPKWYNDGVNYLTSIQEEDGRWSSDFTDGVNSTAFAILFLTRGTKKSIQRAAGFGGRLKGGRGLPSDMTNITIGADGSVVKTPSQAKAETLLALLESANSEEFENAHQNITITLSKDPKQRVQELARFRRLVAADDHTVRLMALKALNTSRDLDNVPTFIFALSDPDPQVVRQARNALRTISRKFNGVGMPENPTDAEKLGAIEKWKDWYLSIRPRAQFLN